MRSETTLAAEQFRLQEWTAQVRDCQNRPNGMSVADWCACNGLTKANYYYRLQRVRKACLEKITQDTAVQQIVPVESRLLKPEKNHSGDPDAGLDIRIKGCSIHVTERTSLQLLAAVIEAQTGNRPYVPDTLYLFCGRRTDRIKGLVWEGDGWLLLYKRLSGSSFQWPRNPDEVRFLTPQQFRWLMEGLTITPKKSVRAVESPEYIG